jgi:hypothetical protein
MTDAKSMNRSRNQLATAYAPNTLFTFEGGVGACISQSSAGERADLMTTTKDQIFERLHEVAFAWYQAALSARTHQAGKPPVLPSQCVDRNLLDENWEEFELPAEDGIYLCKPSHMEYTPAPLTFVCRTCGLFRDFSTLKELSTELPQMRPDLCPHPTGPKGTCYWEQLDVIFVHWSGNWSPAMPGQWDWQPGGARAGRSQCLCGSHEFVLNRKSPQIGSWAFACARCGTPLSQRWLQNDRATLNMLGTPIGKGRLAAPTEVRMEATPYRASSAYYVQAETFIDFQEVGPAHLAKLRPGREEELEEFVALTYGFDSARISHADVEAACAGREECASELTKYRAATKALQQLPDLLPVADQSMKVVLENALQTARDSLALVLEALRSRQILVPKVKLPPAIVSGVREHRELFAPRFDPYRLAIEHATLKSTRLDVDVTTGGKRKYVSFTRLDSDLSAETPSTTEQLQTTARERLSQLGFADMGLIRDFELCRFSFGYSRMEAGPILRQKRDMDMPVRLNLFPAVIHDERSKRPIYVVQQSNQAIYIRLNERRVLRWLQSLECEDMFDITGSQRLGAGLLGASQPMNRFLEGLPEGTAPRVYFYFYTLLHSLSHLVMKRISEYSGLDLGSLGEYIFPADGAFVVYRSGTTMDLGNLSAMWRNAGIAMLNAMLAPRAAQCGTGSLCTHRGGSCPDCLMVPETSCIASNKLLSRSVLRSIGGRPRFDRREMTIQGFLDMNVEG